jgi:hypothetical protein
MSGFEVDTASELGQQLRQRQQIGACGCVDPPDKDTIQRSVRVMVLENVDSNLLMTVLLSHVSPLLIQALRHQPDHGQPSESVCRPLIFCRGPRPTRFVVLTRPAASCIG